MELNKLYDKRASLEEDKSLLETLIRLAKDRLGIKAMSYNGERIQGGKRGKTQFDVICEIADMEKEVNIINEQLDVVTNAINKKLEELDETIPKILEKKVDKRIKNWVIAQDIGISDRTFYRKMKIIRENGINLAQNEPKNKL